ncbi:hypothetical protein PF003_g21093 [Phytophthora fragariae]|nr:hypothetical protein PF003_g21093 [Phytophthora fragariae]
MSSRTPEDGGVVSGRCTRSRYLLSLEKEYGVVRESFRSGLTVVLPVILQSKMYEGNVD